MSPACAWTPAFAADRRISRSVLHCPAHAHVLETPFQPYLRSQRQGEVPSNGAWNPPRCLWNRLARHPWNSSVSQRSFGTGQLGHQHRLSWTAQGKQNRTFSHWEVEPTKARVEGSELLVGQQRLQQRLHALMQLQLRRLRAHWHASVETLVAATVASACLAYPCLAYLGLAPVGTAAVPMKVSGMLAFSVRPKTNGIGPTPVWIRCHFCWLHPGKGCQTSLMIPPEWKRTPLAWSPKVHVAPTANP